jgi:hypothetical protein
MAAPIPSQSGMLSWRRMATSARFAERAANSLRITFGRLSTAAQTSLGTFVPCAGLVTVVGPTRF